MSRHLADKRTPSDGGRVKNFLRLARHPRSLWHREGGPAGRQPPRARVPAHRAGPRGLIEG